MKKHSVIKTLFALCVALLFLVVCFCSCDIPHIKQKIPINGMVEPPHYETVCSTKLDADGHIIAIPETTWICDERYYIQYEIVLSDDSSFTTWQRVPENIYREWESQK